MNSAAKHLNGGGSVEGFCVPVEERSIWRHRRALVRQVLMREVLPRVRLALDLALAATLLIATSPVIFITWLAARVRGGGLQSEAMVGYRGRVFPMFTLRLPGDGIMSLLRRVKVHRLPILVNILRGEMALVGPRPFPSDGTSLRDPLPRMRMDVLPGLICLWWIRKRSNIDYGTELEADREYVVSNSLTRDCGIALRAIPALLYGTRGKESAAPRLTVLGVRVDNMDLTGTIGWIQSSLAGTRPRHVSFVNADCLNIACRDPGYRAALAAADLVLPDGIGLKLAGRILRESVRQNVNGTDLFPRLCAAIEKDSRGVFLLGGRPGVPDAAATWIAENCPGVRVLGTEHGYFTPEEEESVVERIRRSGADLLLVALGAPRQELWIDRHLPHLGVRVAMGVGGLLDFYSGRIPRAPLWVREIGMEWLFRMYQEPRRLWRRYVIGNGLFLARVCNERLLMGGRK